MLMTPKPETTLPAERLAPISAASHPITMTIDVGGSGLKAMLLDAKGKPVSDRQRVVTPDVPTPDAVLKGLDELHKLMGQFDRVSVGFPGVVKRGITLGAFNLHPSWAGFPLQAELEKRWKKPVRVGNDADVAGYGAIKGDGVELVLTLGTGLGGALFTSGHLCPGLEIGHTIWRKKGMTYEDYLGRRGLDRFGKKEWNKLLLEAIKTTEALFNWDHLYLGGGNTKKIDFLSPKNVEIVSNESGLLGGVYLWRDQA
jgi:polyphosphate glucokinase